MTDTLQYLKSSSNGNFFLLAGPCVIENEKMALDIAARIVPVCSRLDIPYAFKGSYRKANRSRVDSFTGIGDEKALKILQKVGREFDVPVVTDIHEAAEAEVAAEYVDILQIPAFLCRQTDLLVAAARTGKMINIKKGQFLAPQDMKQVVLKARHAAKEAGLDEDRFMVCERGASFGYGNLVADMRSLVIMRECNAPVIFDATHSVQLPGGQGTSSGGKREFVPPLARAAAAVGVSGFFMETHPNPCCAKSDGPNMVPLDKMEELLTTLKQIDTLVKTGDQFLENQLR